MRFIATSRLCHVDFAAHEGRKTLPRAFFLGNLEVQQRTLKGLEELVDLALVDTGLAGAAFGVLEPVQKMDVDEVAHQAWREARQPTRLLTDTKSSGLSRPTRPSAGTESETVDEGLELGEVLDSPSEETEGCTVGRPASFS